MRKKYIFIKPLITNYRSASFFFLKSIIDKIYAICMMSTTSAIAVHFQRNIMRSSQRRNWTPITRILFRMHSHTLVLYIRYNNNNNNNKFCSRNVSLFSHENLTVAIVTLMDRANFFFLFVKQNSLHIIFYGFSPLIWFFFLRIFYFYLLSLAINSFWQNK